jgi:hypothetical protein
MGVCLMQDLLEEDSEAATMPLNDGDRAWIRQEIQEGLKGLSFLRLRILAPYLLAGAVIVFVLVQWSGYVEFRTRTEDRLSYIETNLNKLQSQLGLRIPAGLQRLIPPLGHNVKPTELADNLKEAGTLIDAAFRTRLASSPELLQPIRDSLETLRSEPKYNEEVRKAATADLIRLDGYTQFSKALEEGRYPSLQPLQQSLAPSQLSGLMNFRMDCTHPTAGFLNVEPPELGDKIFIFNVVVIGCHQTLDHLIWIDTEFKNATITYNGGPLRLADVRFNNCVFEAGNEPESQKILSLLRGLNGNPAVLFIEPKS